MLTLWFTAALLCPTAHAATPDSYWRWFNLEELGVRIRAPEDWVAPAAGEDGPYRLLSPDAAETGLTVTVTVRRGALPAAVDAARNSVLLLENPDVVEEKDFTADDKTGHMIGYTATDQGAAISGRQYLIAGGKLVYSVDAQSYQAVASSYAAVFDRMAASFQTSLSTESVAASTRAVADGAWIKRGDPALSLSVRTPRNWPASRQGGKFFGEPAELFIVQAPDGDEVGGSISITAREESAADALRWSKKAIAGLPSGRIRGRAPAKSPKGRSSFVLTYSAKAEKTDIVGKLSLLRDGKRVILVDCRDVHDRFKEFSGTCDAVTNSLSTEVGGVADEPAPPVEAAPVGAEE